MNKLNNKKGISLIVLIITIIVIIVLAVAIILSVQSSGIIEKANEAKEKSDVANAKQVVAMAEAEWELMSAEEQKNKENFKVYAEEKLKEAGYKIEEGKGSYEVGENGTVYPYPVIPEGFVASNYADEDTVGEGLVIYKTTTLANVEQKVAKTAYDQFVWVPVTNMKNFTRTGWENNAPTKLESYLTEPSSYNASTTNQYSSEVEEYNVMKASVEKYGGFYVARYEAGDGDTTSKRTTYTTGAHTVVSRKGAYVYNYVGWGTSMTDIASDVVDSDGNNKGKGAVYLSQNMYEKNNNYTTTLIYGVQWDAILRWLSDRYNVTDSRSWGNYANSTGDAATNSGSSDMNYTTGRNESWKAKNIYDLAGNIFEWTMEAYYSSCRLYRGGRYGSYGHEYPVAFRYYYCFPSYTYHDIGFRPVLCLK